MLHVRHNSWQTYWFLGKMKDKKLIYTGRFLIKSLSVQVRSPLIYNIACFTNLYLGYVEFVSIRLVFSASDKLSF